MKELVWKESVNCLQQSGTLLDDRNKTTREMFDCVKTFLKNYGDLVGIILRKIKYMLEYINVNASKAKQFF